VTERGGPLFSFKFFLLFSLFYFYCHGFLDQTQKMKFLLKSISIKTEFEFNTNFSNFYKGLLMSDKNKSNGQNKNSKGPSAKPKTLSSYKQDQAGSGSRESDNNVSKTISNDKNKFQKK